MTFLDSLLCLNKCEKAEKTPPSNDNKNKSQHKHNRTKKEIVNKQNGQVVVTIIIFHTYFLLHFFLFWFRRRRWATQPQANLGRLALVLFHVLFLFLLLLLLLVDFDQLLLHVKLFLLPTFPV